MRVFLIPNFMTKPLNNMSSTAMGLLLGLIGTSLFSIKSIFIKLAYQYHVDFLTFVTLRMLFSIPMYIGVIVYLHYTKTFSPVKKNQLFPILILGICAYYFAAMLDFFGLQYIDANVERFIIHLYPTFVMLLAFLFLKKVPSFRAVSCVFVAYVGLSLVLYEGVFIGENYTLFSDIFSSKKTIGIFAILASAFMFSIYVVFSESYIHRLGAAQFVSMGMLASSMAVLLHFMVEVKSLDSLFEQETEIYLYAFFTAFFATFLPTILMAIAVKQLGAVYTSALGFLGPIISVVAAILLLGETVTTVQVVGMVIIIAGLSFMKIKQSS